MHPRLVLLLNLCVLLVNVVLVMAHTDSQERMLRATTRMVCEAPPPAPYRPVREPAAATADNAGAIRGAIGQLSHIRLLKYLARVDGLERLSARQIAAVHAALEECCGRWVEAEGSARREYGDGTRADGADARRAARATRTEVESSIVRRLDEAAIPDGELRARLVRIVLASAG